MTLKNHRIPKHIEDMGLDFFKMDLIKAFYCYGIFPFNKDNLDYTKLITHDHLISQGKENEKNEMLNPFKVLNQEMRMKYL